jgi:Ulp1 family protease
MRFSEGPNRDEDSIHIWDSGHGKYPTVIHNLRRWLGAIGYRGGANPLNITERYHDQDVPRQRDPFNCGQYMILTAHYLFRYQKPDYTGFTPDLNEPHYSERFDGRYMYGRKVTKYKKDGRIKEKPFTPSVDTVVKNFSDKKVHDYHSMKRWLKKEMKGFK